MKVKTLFQFAVVMLLISTFTHLAAFAGYLPIPNESILEYQSGQIPVPPIIDTDKPQEGLQLVKMLVMNALAYVKIITGVVAILFITILGYRLVANSSDEETVTKAKSSIIYIIIALALVSMAEDIGKLFDMEKKTLLQSPQEILNRIHLFDKQVEIIITFIKYIIGAYAVGMIVRSAFMVIVGGGEEEETTKHKKSILYSAGGLLLIYIGDIFVNKVFYKVDKSVYTGLTGVQPTVDPQAGVAQLIGITNFIVSWVGPVAILMLIIGAIMYVTAGGEDDKMDKAKRVLLTTGIGIIIIFAAFALVSTVIAGRLGEVNAIMTE